MLINAINLNVDQHCVNVVNVDQCYLRIDRQNQWCTASHIFYLAEAFKVFSFGERLVT